MCPIALFLLHLIEAQFWQQIHSVVGDVCPIALVQPGPDVARKQYKRSDIRPDGLNGEYILNIGSILTQA